MSKNRCPLSPTSVVWAYCRDSGGEDQDITSQKAADLAARTGDHESRCHGGESGTPDSATG